MRPIGACGTAWTLALLSWAAPAHAQAVAGVVVDSQDRRIAGAAVLLACGDRTAQSVTDEEGRFSLHRAQGGGSCTLSVSEPGFTPATLAVNPGTGGPTTVRLAVGPVSETIEVRAGPATIPMAAGSVVSRDEMRRI